MVALKLSNNKLSGKVSDLAAALKGMDVLRKLDITGNTIEGQNDEDEEARE